MEDNGETLGYTILEDISQRKNLEKDLKDANNRELQFQQDILEITINTQEAERSRIAEDLHNSLGQLLYSVKLNLDNVKWGNQKQQDENDLPVKNAKDLLSDCIKECKRISHDLVPAILEDFGLEEAVQDICRSHNGSVSFDCQLNGLDAGLPKYMETGIYRIVQELHGNVLKHADATKAEMILKISGNKLTIRVEDNGKGFNLSKSSMEGIGMRSIKNKWECITNCVMI